MIGLFNGKLFGSRIKYFRQQQKLTQEQLSEIADISYYYLIGIEAGKSKQPTVDVIVSLLNALNISYSELMGNNDYKKNVTYSVLYNLQHLNDNEIEFMAYIFSQIKKGKAVKQNESKS